MAYDSKAFQVLIFLTDVTWDTCAIIIDKKVK